MAQIRFPAGSPQRSDKAMLFHFLMNANYNLTNDEFEYEDGRNLGAYKHDNPNFFELAKNVSAVLRSCLHGVFDADGNIINPPPDTDPFNNVFDDEGNYRNPQGKGH